MTGIMISVDTGGWPRTEVDELVETIHRIQERVAVGAMAAQLDGSDLEDDTQGAVELTAEPAEPSGWNEKAYLDVVTKLLRRHSVQVQTIFEAVANGTGYVSRERVYELGMYPADRSLKGFT